MDELFQNMSGEHYLWAGLTISLAMIGQLIAFLPCDLPFPVLLKGVLELAGDEVAESMSIG